MHVRGTDGLLEAGHMVMGDGSRFGVYRGSAGITEMERWQVGKSALQTRVRKCSVQRGVIIRNRDGLVLRQGLRFRGPVLRLTGSQLRNLVLKYPV